MCEAPYAEPLPVYYIYLAGPEVFLPDPVKAGADKTALIARLNDERDWPFRLVGLYPLDPDIPDFKPDRDTGLRIYRANIALDGQGARHRGQHGPLSWVRAWMSARRLRWAICAGRASQCTPTTTPSRSMA